MSVLMSFRGNIFVYQGEELGLPQANIAFKDLQDPEAITNWPETLGRDGARTPMPWSRDNQAAGFSKEKPWLPVDARHMDLTVSAQNGDPNSVLNFYREAITLRKNSQALRQGDIEFLPSASELLLIKRTFGDEVRICAFNLTDKAIDITLPTNCAPVLSVGAPVSGGQLPAYSGFIGAPI